MKKLLKSKKALSPVVAAIILIAVTVAVSIAVAAWMGSLTFTFMETEQISFTKVEFGDGTSTNDRVTVYLQNTGTSDIVFTEALITGNGVDDTVTITTAAGTIVKGTSDNIALQFTGTNAWVAGSAYNIELHSSKGNKFPVTETA
jgi:flagellin-like protein